MSKIRLKKDIVKYKNHPSILTIQAKHNSKNKVSFTEVATQNIEKKILLKSFSNFSYIDIIAEFLNTSCNSSIESSLIYCRFAASKFASCDTIAQERKKRCKTKQ